MIAPTVIYDDDVEWLRRFMVSCRFAKPSRKDLYRAWLIVNGLTAMYFEAERTDPINELLDLDFG